MIGVLARRSSRDYILAMKNTHENTHEAETLLMLALQQSPAAAGSGNEWFQSLRIEASRMNDHDSFEDASEDGCVYGLHDENVFTLDAVHRLLEGLANTLRIEGLAANVTQYRFSIRIEGDEGRWLVPINDVPFDRIFNVIELCEDWQEGLYEKNEAEQKLSSEDWRMRESVADTLISEAMPELSEETQKLLSTAWRRASRELEEKFKFEV